MARQQTLRVGIDTGGTFTDAVAVGPQGRRTCKVPSTPERPEEGFLAALDGVGGRRADVAVRHGTTVGTNAVLTRRGARVVLLLTEGFTDLPWLGRGVREDLHARAPARTPPLIAVGDALGVRERLDATGAVVRALGEREVRRVVAAVRRLRPEAVAVCLLHAVRNPQHERRLAAALRVLDVPVHVSTAACADPREVERSVTVTLDAFVAPVLGRYLAAVAAGLPAEARAAFTVMRSDGGRMGAAEVATAPARTLLSGPAAGVAAAQALVVRHGVAQALSFDVGGTSTDVAWIEGEDVPVGPRLRVGPFEASVPSVGLETVGAGGGSVVWTDAGGALRVGPQSAGARPGPACYGHGGPFALTDAWLLLGHVPAALLGGDFPLDVGAAERAGRSHARKLGCSLLQLARGALEVAAAATARALRLASVAHGHDPRGATLVAFGGAGPLLAAGTAERLGIGRILVPADPGTFAAEGALLAPLRADAEALVEGTSAAAVRQTAARLAREVTARLRAEGARRSTLRTEVDARYPAQAFEVSVPWDAGWEARFHERHEARYGFCLREVGPQAVRLRVRGQGQESEAGADALPPAASRRRRAHTGPRALRDTLAPGARLLGPCRIEEPSGTTWVPGGWAAQVLGDRTLCLEPVR